MIFFIISSVSTPSHALFVNITSTIFINVSLYSVLPWLILFIISNYHHIWTSALGGYKNKFIFFQRPYNVQNFVDNKIILFHTSTKPAIAINRMWFKYSFTIIIRRFRPVWVSPSFTVHKRFRCKSHSTKRSDIWSNNSDFHDREMAGKKFVASYTCILSM